MKTKNVSPQNIVEYFDEKGECWSSGAYLTLSEFKQSLEPSFQYVSEIELLTNLLNITANLRPLNLKTKALCTAIMDASDRNRAEGKSDLAQILKTTRRQMSLDGKHFELHPGLKRALKNHFKLLLSSRTGAHAKVSILPSLKDEYEYLISQARQLKEGITVVCPDESYLNDLLAYLKVRATELVSGDCDQSLRANNAIDNLRKIYSQDTLVPWEQIHGLVTEVLAAADEHSSNAWASINHEAEHITSKDLPRSLTALSQKTSGFTRVALTDICKAIDTGEDIEYLKTSETDAPWSPIKLITPGQALYTFREHLFIPAFNKRYYPLPTDITTDFLSLKDSTAGRLEANREFIGALRAKNTKVRFSMAAADDLGECHPPMFITCHTTPVEGKTNQAAHGKVKERGMAESQRPFKSISTIPAGLLNSVTICEMRGILDHQYKPRNLKPVSADLHFGHIRQLAEQTLQSVVHKNPKLDKIESRHITLYKASNSVIDKFINEWPVTIERAQMSFYQNAIIRLATRLLEYINDDIGINKIYNTPAQHVEIDEGDDVRLRFRTQFNGYQDGSRVAINLTTLTQLQMLHRAKSWDANLAAAAIQPELKPDLLIQIGYDKRTINSHSVKLGGDAHSKFKSALHERATNLMQSSASPSLNSTCSTCNYQKVCPAC